MCRAQLAATVRLGSKSNRLDAEGFSIRHGKASAELDRHRSFAPFVYVNTARRPTAMIVTATISKIMLRSFDQGA
jgi:hypothetical protein